MARYTIYMNTKEYPKPFVGFDNLEDGCVEATNAESLGVKMPDYQREIFRSLEPGEYYDDGVLSYFRE